MKKIKYVSILMLILIFVFSFPVYAAKPKLNKKKATLIVGQTVQLKVKNNTKKVTWSSNNKKVAIVSKKGVVKSIKPGKCEITAKVGKKKYVCVITVKSTPTSTPTPTPTPTPEPEIINVDDYIKTVTLTEANIYDYFEVVYDFDTHGVNLPTATGSVYIKDKLVKDGWYPLDDGTDFKFKLSTTYWNGKNQVISEDIEYNYNKMKCTRTLFHDTTLEDFKYSFSDVSGTLKYVNQKAITNIIPGIQTETGWTHGSVTLVTGKKKSLAIFYLDGRYF